MHIKDICANMGLQLTGSMCFGLSDAFNFLYWLDRNSKIPFLILLGRNQDIFGTFFDKMGIDYKVNTMHSALEMKEHIVNCINSNTLLLLYVDRYYLEYLHSKYSKSHFGNHVIAISGYRINNDVFEVAVNDMIQDDIIWYAFDKIHMAMNSSWKPFSPEARVYDINLNSSKLNLYFDMFPEIIVDSIENVIINMIGKDDMGVNALYALAYEMNKLLESDFSKYERALRFQLRLISSFISEFEETHSMYRMCFSNFLGDAAKKYKLEYLYDYSLQMRVIAGKWRSVSELLTQDRLEIEDIICQISSEINEIADSEKAFFTSLKQELSYRQNDNI
jgi:hypothetical protein